MLLKSAHELLPLRASQIHLWLAFPDEICEPQLLGCYRQLLDLTEREREARFHLARDRHRYLVTRALVRTVLSRYLTLRPKDWMFAADASGRPVVANVAAADCSLSFNISHTNGLIALAVSKSRAVGVDVEKLEPRSVSIEIANRYFAPEEALVLNTATAHEQTYRFYEYWTFKESYLKARGIGLSLSLDKCRFHYANERSVELIIDPKLGDSPKRWQLWQLRPRGEYLLALCAERREAGGTELMVCETIPMVSETVVVPDFLRISS